jgi:hypothetical protein
MRDSAQPDLFGSPHDGASRQPDLFEPMPESFVAQIREELLATLALARDAETLPWPNLTRATLEELRFNSIANYLPRAEADDLRARFGAELARLYQLADEAEQS